MTIKSRLAKAAKQHWMKVYDSLDFEREKVINAFEAGAKWQAARTGGEVEPVGVPAGTTYLPVITENLLSEYGDTELVENGQWSQLAVDFSCDIPVKKYPPQAAKVPEGFSVERRPDCIVITRHSDMAGAAYSPDSGLVIEVMGWHFLDALLTAAPQPVGDGEEHTEESARKLAWEEVKNDCDLHGLTVGELSCYYGFFCWGWDYRKQYGHQLSAQPPEGERKG